MKIFLTGAEGFTGQHFSQTAILAGHEIVPCKSDLTDATALRNELAATQPDGIVHLAAISFVGHTDTSAFYKVNVLGTTNLLDAALPLSSQLKKVILASSANIYGNNPNSPLSELEPPAPLNHYAMSKLAMEYMARTYSNALPIVITRPFNYTGVGQDINFLMPKLVSHFAKKSSTIKLGNLDVQREFNDISLVCNAYLGLLDFGERGHTYNICSGILFSLLDVVNMLEQLTHHHPSVEVNSQLVRPNELKILCGNPSKLQQLFSINNAELPRNNFEKLLRTMLNAYA